jgi:ribosomal protein S18 acetylase RimI-like enzyme
LNERAMSGTPEYVSEAPDDDLQAVTKHYLGGAGEFLVGTVEGTVVAMGAYTALDGWKADRLDIDDSAAELTRMRVHPGWQGQGIGTAVYAELERLARADGYRRFVLDTGAENDTARGFYEHLGFRCSEEATVEFGDVALDLALYEKTLTE